MIKHEIKLPILLEERSGSPVGEIEERSEERSLLNKNFSCTKYNCGFKTNSRSCLYKHIRRHDKTKKFFCDQCDFATHCKGSLNYHLKRHKIGEFECKKCNMFFVRRIDLKYHNDKRHPVFDVMDFSDADFFQYLNQESGSPMGEIDIDIDID